MQIKATQIYFWDEKRENLPEYIIKQLHEEKIYPPAVELTLRVLETHPTKLFIKFDGLTASNNLDMEIMLPLGNNCFCNDSIRFSNLG